MNNLSKISFLIVIFLITGLCFIRSAFAQERVSLTTYYPAPYGVYDHIITDTLGVGDNSGDGDLTIADSPDPDTAINEGDAWIAGNMAIGLDTSAKLNNLRSRLNVLGSVAIGSGVMDETLPDDSLLVEGDMLIGTDTLPVSNGALAASLVIDNTLRLTPTDSPQERTVTVLNPEGAEGGFYFDSSEAKFKYHDGSDWKLITGSFSLGDQVEYENPNDLQKKPGSNELGRDQCSSADISGCDPRSGPSCGCQNTSAEADTATDFGGSSFAGQGGPNNGNVVGCASGQVMTGLRLITAMHCDSSCGSQHVRVKRLVARCRPIE